MIRSYGEWFDICLRHAKVDMIFDILASWKADMYVQLEEIHKLESENKRLREALAWYADDKNYSYNVPGKKAPSSVWIGDMGERARMALKGGEG